MLKGEKENAKCHVKKKKTGSELVRFFPSSIIPKTGFFLIPALLFLLNRNEIQC